MHSERNNQNEKTACGRETIFASHTSDKGLIYKICKSNQNSIAKMHNSIPENTSNPFKKDKGPEICFSKECKQIAKTYMQRC